MATGVLALIPPSQQPGLNLLQLAYTHVHHQRRAAFGQRLPFEAAVILGVRGDQCYATCYAALGQRDAALRGAGQAGGDAVDQLDLDAARRQPFGLLAATAEDARIATLEAHTHLP